MSTLKELDMSQHEMSTLEATAAQLLNLLKDVKSTQLQHMATAKSILWQVAEALIALKNELNSTSLDSPSVRENHTSTNLQIAQFNGRLCNGNNNASPEEQKDNIDELHHPDNKLINGHKCQQEAKDISKRTHYNSSSQNGKNKLNESTVQPQNTLLTNKAITTKCTKSQQGTESSHSVTENHAGANKVLPYQILNSKENLFQNKSKHTTKDSKLSCKLASALEKKDIRNGKEEQKHKFLRKNQTTKQKKEADGRPIRCEICLKTFSGQRGVKTHILQDHGIEETKNSISLLCDVCGESSSCIKDLTLHIGSHVNKVKFKIKQGSFTCDVCNQDFLNRRALVTHYKRHVSSNEFCCEFCSEKFSSPTQLKSHREIHKEDDRPYKCLHCGKGFKLQTTLRTHKMVHTGEQPYSCDICGKRFIQTSGLNIHKLKHTAEEETKHSSQTAIDSSQYRCDICGQMYKTRVRLQRHTKSHDQSHDIHCKFCPKMFTSAREAAIHQKVHQKGELHCKQCGQIFKSRNEYFFHKMQHESEDRLHMCAKCGKSFISQSELASHERRHEKQPEQEKQLPKDSFVCTSCGKTYASRSSLNIHIKTHTGEFDLACDLCPKKFKCPAELRHHLRVHTREKPYMCDVCDKAFARHSTLANHKRSHGEERPFVCDVCGAAFKLRNTLRTHSKIHTREAQPPPKSDDRPFLCAVCGATFKLKNILKKHSRIHAREGGLQHPHAAVPTESQQSSLKKGKVEKEQSTTREFLQQESLSQASADSDSQSNIIIPVPFPSSPGSADLLDPTTPYANPSVLSTGRTETLLPLSDQEPRLATPKTCETPTQPQRETPQLPDDMTFQPEQFLRTSPTNVGSLQSQTENITDSFHFQSMASQRMRMFSPLSLSLSPDPEDSIFNEPIQPPYHTDQLPLEALANLSQQTLRLLGISINPHPTQQQQAPWHQRQVVTHNRPPHSQLTIPHLNEPNTQGTSHQIFRPSPGQQQLSGTPLIHPTQQVMRPLEQLARPISTEELNNDGHNSTSSTPLRPQSSSLPSDPLISMVSSPRSSQVFRQQTGLGQTRQPMSLDSSSTQTHHSITSSSGHLLLNQTNHTVPISPGPPSERSLSAMDFSLDHPLDHLHQTSLRLASDDQSLVRSSTIGQSLTRGGQFNQPQSRTDPFNIGRNLGNESAINQTQIRQNPTNQPLLVNQTLMPGSNFDPTLIGQSQTRTHPANQSLMRMHSVDQPLISLRPATPPSAFIPHNNLLAQQVRQTLLTSAGLLFVPETRNPNNQIHLLNPSVSPTIPGLLTTNNGQTLLLLTSNPVQLEQIQNVPEEQTRLFPSGGLDDHLDVEGEDDEVEMEGEEQEENSGPAFMSTNQLETHFGTEEVDMNEEDGEDLISIDHINNQLHGNNNGGEEERDDNGEDTSDLIDMNSNTQYTYYYY